jgi:hypothetical protein
MPTLRSDRHGGFRLSTAVAVGSAASLASPGSYEAKRVMVRSGLVGSSLSATTEQFPEKSMSTRGLDPRLPLLPAGATAAWRAQGLNVGIGASRQA